MDKIVYQIVYFDVYGNFHNTNLEYKTKEIGMLGVDLEVGNHKDFDTKYIQLYESVYNRLDERISTVLIYEKEVLK